MNTSKTIKKAGFLTLVIALAFIFQAPKQASAQTACTIDSFYSDLTSVTAGQGTTLYWNTSGCSFVTLQTGTTNNANQQLTSPYYTGALNATTTFTLFASGQSSSINRTVTVNVSGGQYNYQSACSDGVDNDGNGLVDYPNDPGCSSPSDNEELSGGTTAGSDMNVITNAATNVGSATTRLNGLILNTKYPVSAYFEYGTTTALGHLAPSQYLSPDDSLPYSYTISVLPNTTYYYRAVIQTNAMTVRGSLSSFITPDSAVTYIAGNTTSSTSTSSTTTSTTSTTTGSTAQTSSNGVTVTVADKGDAINIGDTVEYTITYTNGTKQALNDATLSVTLPQGFTVKQSTQGMIVTPTTITASLGTMPAGTSGSMFVEAIVGPTVARGETLVTTATLAYALPSGVHDSAVGYVINHASATNVLAGFALGSGFFPSTIFGWLITILIILAIILIARRVARAKHGGGHDAGAHH